MSVPGAARAPRVETPGGPSAGSRLHPVTDATFAADVLRADRPVLVDFWAPWCAPCRLVVPLLEEIAAEEAVDVRTLNVDGNPVTAASYGIRSMPTLLAFVGGEVVHAVVGARPGHALRAELAVVLGA